MRHLGETGHSLYFEQQVRWPEDLRKAKEEEKRRYTTTVTQRQQRMLFRISISVNQLSVYGAVSDWCEEFAQKISDPYSTIAGKHVAELNDESESRVAPNVVSIFTNSPFDHCSSTRRPSKILQKTFG